MTARALLGNGMVGMGADINKLYPMYQKAQIEAQMNGDAPLPPFDQWAKMQMSQGNPYR